MAPTKTKKEPAPKKAAPAMKAKKITKKALAMKKAPKKAVSEVAALLPAAVPAVKALA